MGWNDRFGRAISILNARDLDEITKVKCVGREKQTTQDRALGKHGIQGGSEGKILLTSTGSVMGRTKAGFGELSRSAYVLQVRKWEEGLMGCVSE